MELKFETGEKRPIAIPDFDEFSARFNADLAYNRIRNFSDDQVSAARLETFIISGNYDLTNIIFFWNRTLARVAETAKPTAEEIVVWNTICTEAEMPFTFKNDGVIEMPTET